MANILLHEEGRLWGHLNVSKNGLYGSIIMHHFYHSVSKISDNKSCNSAKMAQYCAAIATQCMNIAWIRSMPPLTDQHDNLLYQKFTTHKWVFSKSFYPLALFKGSHDYFNLRIKCSQPFTQHYGYLQTKYTINVMHNLMTSEMILFQLTYVIH